MALKKIVREAKEIWNEGKEFVTGAKEAWSTRKSDYEKIVGTKKPKKNKGY